MHGHQNTILDSGGEKGYVPSMNTNGSYYWGHCADRNDGRIHYFHCRYTQTSENHIPLSTHFHFPWNLIQSTGKLMQPENRIISIGIW